MKSITTLLLALFGLVLSVILVQPRVDAFSLTASDPGMALPPTLDHATALTDVTLSPIRVWRLDGSLVSLDGQAPLLSQGIAFVPGRFDRAAEFSRAAHSRLIYRAADLVDPDEGSLTLWFRPTYDLTDSVYQDHPQLFSYAIDRDNGLVVEVGDGCVRLSQRQRGRWLPGACLPVSGWRAGEWHHLAVTWSASQNETVMYGDCTSTATGAYAALNGNGASFQLGGDANRRAIDAALDDVRLSRRALSASEIAAICRDRPLPGATNIIPSVPLEPTPLGTLQPITNLLPYGTVSFTLNLTTTAEANCRWSEAAATLYVSMPHDFQW